MSNALPVILIEVVLVFGGVLAFGWWQLRSVARDRREALARRAQSQPQPQTQPRTQPSEVTPAASADPPASRVGNAAGSPSAQSITAPQGTDQALP